MRQNGFFYGVIFLAVAQMMVGINIVVSKILLESVHVLVLLEIRFILAALTLFPLHWTTSARKIAIKTHLNPLKSRDWGFIFAQALCAGALFNFLMLTGLSHTDANVAGIITSALPAIIAILSWLVLGEKISAQKALCVVFATVGLVVIAVGKFSGFTAYHSFFGDAIVLLSLLPEATYYILCKVYHNRLPIFLTSSLLNGINALLLLPVLFFTTWVPSEISFNLWFLMLLTGVSSGLFYVFWFLGAKHVDGIMASLSTAIMPVATVIFAWIILGEQLSIYELSGMGLILFSIFLYARR